MSRSALTKPHTLTTPRLETLKARAVRLLAEYDALRAALPRLEHELARACTEYGRERGYYLGYTRNALRCDLMHERRIDGEHPAPLRLRVPCLKSVA